MLDQQELTFARFVPNVIEKPEDDVLHWKNMHRLGDLGRWLDDGQLLVERRVHIQIKSRGLRIDLADIEHTILDAVHGELSVAVVSVHRLSIQQYKFLVAHVVYTQTDKEGKT